VNIPLSPELEPLIAEKSLTDNLIRGVVAPAPKLGGTFSSRLVSNIREDKGYTIKLS
jgi:hypothetical protein